MPFSISFSSLSTLKIVILCSWLSGEGNGLLSLSFFSLSCIGEENGNTLQCFCLENPRDGGAQWAAVYGVTQSRTPLKRLSSSSSSSCSWLSLLLMWNQLSIYLLLINILAFLSGCFWNNCVFVFWSFTTMCLGMHFFLIILLDASWI